MSVWRCLRSPKEEMTIPQHQAKQLTTINMFGLLVNVHVRYCQSQRRLL